jgi:hypothetical protein
MRFSQPMTRNEQKCIREDVLGYEKAKMQQGKWVRV